MARKQFQTLSEPMYYVLLSLTKECCGVDIMKNVETISNGRIRVGLGSLRIIKRKFQQAGLIKETSVEGRKISYIITEDGINILKEEYNRLLLMVNDGKTFLDK